MKTILLKPTTCHWESLFSIIVPMKRIIFALILGLLVASPDTASAKELLDRIVAVVNDDVITQSELDRQLAPIYQSYKEQYKGNEFFTQMTDARGKVLNQMIEDRLVLQEAEEKEVRVTDQEIQRKVDEFKRRFKTDEDFKRFLDGQGITMSKIREKYRDMLAIQKIQDFVVKSRVVVSPLEARSYYEKNSDKFSAPESFSIYSITIRKDDAKDKNKKVQAKTVKIRKQIVSGEINFAAAAQEYSEDTHADEGGDMGVMSRGEFIPHLEDAIFSLQEGEMTEVLESDIGYHIFLLKQINPAATRSFDESEESIEGYLYQQKSAEKFEEWMGRLRKDAYVSIR
jgi:peptidyl-prolyl cis-trans isomerase SurA